MNQYNIVSIHDMMHICIISSKRHIHHVQERIGFYADILASTWFSRSDDIESLQVLDSAFEAAIIQIGGVKYVECHISDKNAT